MDRKQPIPWRGLLLKDFIVCLVSELLAGTQPSQVPEPAAESSHYRRSVWHVLEARIIQK